MKTKYVLQEIGVGTMRRCFLPVGQGAFYCESFMVDGMREPVNVLFDCGTLPRVGMSSRIDKALAFALDGIKTIHLAFLSHLHDDHVNGLSLLKEHHQIQIQEIHYPAISDEDKFLMKFWYKTAGQEKGPAWEFCLEPEVLKRRFPASETKLVPVEVVDQSSVSEEYTRTGNNPNKVPFPGVVWKNAEVDEGDVNECVFQEWSFQTFNFRREKLIRHLKEELKTSLGLEGDVTDGVLSKKWETPGGRQLIKRAYAKVANGDFNANSMVVFSGPTVQAGEEWSQKLICCHSLPCQMNGNLSKYAPGCLYTGDYDASDDDSWEELTRFYSHQWNKIGCLQVPHHGACLNFNDKLLDMNAIFVASAGANNKYGHPNACVRLAFQQHNKSLWCVTEHAASCLCTCVLCRFPHGKRVVTLKF